MICMKNSNYVINGVLAIAVIILFILQFSGGKNDISPSSTTITSSGDYASNIPVAYFDVDALLDNYFFSIDLTEQIVKKREDANAYLTQKDRELQTAFESFQYRAQNNAFATQQRAEQEQQRLVRQQKELEETAERMNMDLMAEIQQLNEQLRDTIVNHLREYNQLKQFHIIFSSGSSNIVNPIVYANESYNITDEVIVFLNKKWSPSSIK
jgi:Outer membrane protein